VCVCVWQAEVRHIFRLKRHNVLHIVCFARGKRWKAMAQRWATATKEGVTIYSHILYYFSLYCPGHKAHVNHRTPW